MRPLRLQRRAVAPNLSPLTGLLAHCRVFLIDRPRALRRAIGWHLGRRIMMLTLTAPRAHALPHTSMHHAALRLANGREGHPQAAASRLHPSRRRRPLSGGLRCWWTLAGLKLARLPVARARAELSLRDLPKRDLRG
jgi:hypothetical protein